MACPGCLLCSLFSRQPNGAQQWFQQKTVGPKFVSASSIWHRQGSPFPDRPKLMPPEMGLHADVHVLCTIETCNVVLRQSVPQLYNIHPCTCCSDMLQRCFIASVSTRVPTPPVHGQLGTEGATGQALSRCKTILLYPSTLAGAWCFGAGELCYYVCG